MIWPYSGLFGLYDFENGKRWRHMNFYLQLILKSPKNYENLVFLTSGLCLAFKIFFSLFFNFPDLQMSWIFQIIQIWIILKQFCHQIIFAEKFANRISVMHKVEKKSLKKSEKKNWFFQLVFLTNHMIFHVWSQMFQYCCCCCLMFIYTKVH